MENKKHPKNLIFLRIIASLIVILAMVLPYFGVIKHTTGPFVILITLLAFWGVENKYNKKTKTN